jgi:hypothetical protein
MECAVYYPGFEVQNENWLKFALLYVDRLHPIIPPRDDHQHSELFKVISGATDLIDPHAPDDQDGYLASLDAVDKVKKILSRPGDFSRVFHTTDVTVRWKHPANWRYKILREKFSEVWLAFCLQNKIGKIHTGGILLERSLGLLYMSILANIIAEGRELPALTDNVEMDHISLLTRRAPPSALKQVSTATNVIKLKLPTRLDKIPIGKIILHRNKDGFKEKLHAFHTELRAYLHDFENGKTAEDFLSTRGKAFTEFSDELALLGSGAIVLTLGVTVVLSKPEDTLEMAEKIGGASALAVRSLIGIRTAWKHSRNKRFTRKYLADLASLS